VAFAAFFNFVAAFAFGTAVANTISKIVNLGYVPAEIIPFIVLSALMGAISWNIITWFAGLPTSSSHALIGGMMGAGISAAGIAAIHWSAISLVVVFMVISPLIGLVIGYFFMAAVLRTTKNTNKERANGYFKKLQICSAAAYSYSHGTNDAQKTMGIIIPLLFSIGYFGTSADPNNLPVPIWVILLAHTAIALGTLLGGWRIVKTMGYKITRLKPVHGFSAETASATTILSASVFGIPVSTTQVICASIMGVGSTMGTSAVKWGVARSIMWAWILTIPISAGIAFISFAGIRLFF
jgi:PiT family inorganic phosphate transporter